VNTNSLFDMAQLAEASYADFWDDSINQVITDPDGVKTALINRKFSNTQADKFLLSWKVVHHQPNTATGFSATLFESKHNTGQYVFAARGTAGVIDLVGADILEIVGHGLAYSQITDMYNYWQWLNATSGSTYQVAKITDFVAQLAPTISFESSDVAYSTGDPKAAGLGITTNVANIDVTGQNQ